MIAKFDAGAERSELRFEESVTREFAFLESDFAFHRVQQNVTFVRYESDRLFLNIFHGRGSYEIGVELGRLSNPAVHYRLSSLVAALAPGYTGRTVFQASSRKGVKSCVAELAGVLRMCCGAVLVGDARALRMLEQEASAESKRVTRQAQFGAILASADRAWEAKDFRRAKNLYQKAETALDGPRRRRLEYLIGREEGPTR